MIYPDGGSVWCSPTSLSMVLSYWDGYTGPREPRVRAAVPLTDLVADTERLCGDALGWFPACECRNYIRHAGYGLCLTFPP